MESLKNSQKWTNVEKVLIPILPRLVKKRAETAHAATLEFLLTNDAVPPVVQKDIAKLLLEDAEDTNILSTMHQRYPDVLGTAIEELVAEGKGNRVELEALLMSLAIVSSFTVL